MEALANFLVPMDQLESVILHYNTGLCTIQRYDSSFMPKKRNMNLVLKPKIEFSQNLVIFLHFHFHRDTAFLILKIIAIKILW
ncbi:uncharacterized protein CANTADRAFT_267610 [Suhomyces tanzawaensis NRRL Y-17324]|uniref:Uncharacterized protein n=1 Tax=Suhomyces tanzawaensis NRRL Y-17324 TaxID=984487 RepID=A0A1E4SG59_9ASCO|nr:uncharacterized protein CANTADRAFT_267610 [Suhomyces tanzawaensis NRRL Y-17324]ODV78498.1 hypothetical protein CANTADRAFT_267610 [Suhomyces tanzawaensis NRRL Y-17324]